MAFEILAVIRLDGTGYTRQLNQLEQQAKGFGANVSKSFAGIQNQLANAFGIGALISFTTQTVKSVGAIADLAEQFNISTDEVQELQEAAALAGLSFDNFGSALNRVNEARQQAIQGNRELAATFEKIGVTAKDSDLQALVKMTSLDRTELGDITGVKNEKIIAALKNLASVKDIFKVDPETIASIDKLGDKIRNLKREFMGVFAQGISDFLGGDFLALTPQGFLRRRQEARDRAFNESQNRPSGLPGVFETIESGGRVGGPPGTREEVSRLKKSELELEKAIAKLEFERLNPKQQEKKLQEDINDLKADAAELNKSENALDRSIANENLALAAQKEMQLITLQKRDNDRLPMVTDALAKVGGFTGANMAPTEELRVQKLQLDELQKIRENTRGGSAGGYP